MDLIYVIYYLAGLLSAYAFDDLSYNKSAIQSHTYRDTIYEAGNAVDGNILTCMRTLEIGQSSFHKTVWWKVDLGGVYNIYSINIVFRNYESWDDWVNRQRGRFAGFSLYVSVTGDIQGSILCYKDGPQLPPLNFTTTCTEHGRYVIFYNERLDGAKYPAEYETGNVYTELCEVIVQGCKVSGVFGINCDKPCPANCKENLCHIENGSCFWCKTGWTGKFCDTACQPGYFGENCSMPCSPNCKTCRNTDGLCSCKAGWMGHNCSTECTQSYGENCQYSCSLHCINQTCDRFNGNCLCDVKLDRMQDVETNNVASSTLWIVAFSISLAIHIICISATFISRRKTFLKQKSTTEKVNFSWRSRFNKEQTGTSENPSHYQEVGVSQNENTYQTLNQPVTHTV